MEQKRRLLKKMAVFALVFGMLFSTELLLTQAKVPNVEQEGYFSIPEKIEKPDQEGAAPDLLLRIGYDSDLGPEGAEGKVKWFVSNDRIVKIISKNGQKCRIRAMNTGRAIVTAVAQNQVTKYNVVIKCRDSYAEAWCRQWVADYISDDMDFKTKLLTASEYLCSSLYQYGYNTDAADVITDKQGTCLGGAYLLQMMYRAMGFEAHVRYAAKDDMTRYPSTILFEGGHYNVVVIVNGENYYLDGTPGTGFVYLSTEDKALFLGWEKGSYWDIDGEDTD